MGVHVGDMSRDLRGDAPVEELPTCTLEDLVEFIPLGPTVSSPLAKATFIRMLRGINILTLEGCVISPTIPS
jgi:hypothetical protein